MKKTICTTLVLALLALVCCLTLAACQQNPLSRASKNADNYTIVCSYDDTAHVLSAVQTVQLTNRSENSFTAVKFHIYPNQYREDAANSVVPSSYNLIAYPNGQSFGDISFESVKVEGTGVPFSIEGEDMDILSVPTSEWFPNQKLNVEMTYTVQLANIKHRLGWTENSVNLGNFFPVVCHLDNDNYSCTPYYNIGDPFVSDCANFDVTLKINEKYLVASTGNLTEANAERGTVTYHYTAEAVRDFAFVASNKFTKISQTVGETTINYFYYDDTDAEKSLNTAVGAYQYYTENIGDYPYNQLSVCETDFCYGGMEYPCLVMITSGTASYQEAIAHEVAHQWFYGVVGNDQIANAWMDEGLAEYLTYLYMDSAGVTKLSRYVLQNLQTYTTYVDVLTNYYNTADTTFRSLAEYKNDNEYVVMTYLKGSLMFNTVHETMGATKFFKALSNYYDEAMFTVAPASQLIDNFRAVGGTEIGTIFEKFAAGKEILGKITD